MKDHYFFVDNRSYNQNSKFKITKLSNIFNKDIPLILSMIDANFKDVVSAVQYRPDELEINVFAKENLDFIGINYKEQIKNCFFNTKVEKTKENLICDIKKVLERNKKFFNESINYQIDRYEQILKEKNSHSFVIFIKPNEKLNNLVIAIGKDEGTAYKIFWSPQENTLEDKILLNIIQLYRLEDTYKTPFKRSTNYENISLIIKNNEIIYEIKVLDKIWYINEKDILKWLDEDVYKSFCSSLSIYLNQNNWFDDALLLSSYKKRTRV